MNTVELKSELHRQCRGKIHDRYLKIKKTIADIAEALLGETKSSSGDKHETGRAMLQIERENAGRQLLEVEKIQAILNKIDVHTISDHAHLGSIVYTNNAVYFLSISIGKVSVNKIDYLCVSLSSPIGQLLMGKKKGDTFNFNEKEFKISSIR